MLTRDEILARKVGHTKYVLPDGSGEVAIKAITHTAAAEVGRAREDGDVGRATALIIYHGLVEPELSLEDVQAWMHDDAAGTLEHVAQAIGKLSHMFEGAEKSRVSTPRKRR